MGTRMIHPDDLQMFNSTILNLNCHDSNMSLHLLRKCETLLLNQGMTCCG